MVVVVVVVVVVEACRRVEVNRYCGDDDAFREVLREVFDTVNGDGGGGVHWLLASDDATKVEYGHGHVPTAAPPRVNAAVWSCSPRAPRVPKRATFAVVEVNIVAYSVNESNHPMYDALVE